MKSRTVKLMVTRKKLALLPAILALHLARSSHLCGRTILRSSGLADGPGDGQPPGAPSAGNFSVWGSLGG